MSTHISQLDIESRHLAEIWALIILLKLNGLLRKLRFFFFYMMFFFLVMQYFGFYPFLRNSNVAINLRMCT